MRIADGNHVLKLFQRLKSIAFTKHNLRGIEFPGGKGNAGKVVLKQLPVNYMKKQAPKLKIFIT